MDQHLGVGVVGLEAVAGGFEVCSQFAVVVDAAVEGDGDEVGFGGEGCGVEGGGSPLACARGSSEGGGWRVGLGGVWGINGLWPVADARGSFRGVIERGRRAEEFA